MKAKEQGVTLQSLDRRLNKIEKRVDTVEQRLDKVEFRLRVLEEQVKKNTDAIERLERKLDHNTDLILTAIDGIAKQMSTFQAEMAAARVRSDRHDQRIEQNTKNITKLNVRIGAASL